MKEHDNHSQPNVLDSTKNESVPQQRRGTTHKGPYVLGATLGEGAFAKVKVATHIHTQEKVAIKILDKTKLFEDNGDIIRVQKEINILKKLRHKNIIQLYEVMESKMNLYIVMEYCEGKELFDYIVEKKRIPEAEACKFFQEIINGLEYLHQQNIAHRDLKPENILLDYKQTIKISDFGLSTIYERGSLLSTPCGTPSYAPPEMLRGQEYQGLLSDIWSCGIILYAMLCGCLPFSESKEDIICQKIMESDYEIPDYLSPLVVDLLNNILMIDPGKRYTIEKVKSHPWFYLVNPQLRPGITVGLHKIPIDEEILAQVENYGYNKEKCRTNLLNNKYDSITSVYYLCLRKFMKEGGESVSDLFSQKFEEFLLTHVSTDKDKATKAKAITDLLTNITIGPSKLESKKVDSNFSTNRETKHDLNVNVNLNVKLNVKTNNNITISGTPLGEKEKLVPPNATETMKNKPTINHKVSNSSNFTDKNVKVYNKKLKEFSSSVANPLVNKELPSPKNYTTLKSYNKNSFVSTTYSGIKKKTNDLNSLISPTASIKLQNSSTNKKEIKTSSLSLKNKAKEVKFNTSKKPSLKKENSKDLKMSMENLPSYVVNQSLSLNSLSDIKMNLNSNVMNKDLDDELFDDEIKLDSGINVLEYIAKKLVGKNIFKQQNSRRDNKFNNNSFVEKSTIKRGDSIVSSTSSKGVSYKLSDRKNTQEQSEFRNVVDILNKKYKTFYESQKDEINLDDFDTKLDLDDKEFHLNNYKIISKKNASKAFNAHSKSKSRAPDISRTLRNTKTYKYKYENLAKRKYSSQEDNKATNNHIKLKHYASGKPNLKQLEISSNYDPDLELRGETSVERSVTRKNDLKNSSFSPCTKIESNTSSNIPGEIQGTSSKHNVNNLFPVHTTSRCLSTKQVGQQGHIGVISEDEEFYNFNSGIHAKSQSEEVKSPLKQTDNLKVNRKNLLPSEKRVTINLHSGSSTLNKKKNLIINISEDISNNQTLRSPTKEINTNTPTVKGSNKVLNYSTFNEKLKKDTENKQLTGPNQISFKAGIQPSAIKGPIKINKIDLNGTTPEKTKQEDIPNCELFNMVKEVLRENNQPRKHQRITSAVELNSLIITENVNEYCQVVNSKHKRTNSQTNSISLDKNFNVISQETKQSSGKNDLKPLSLPLDKIQNNQNYNTERQNKSEPISEFLDEFYKKSANTNRTDYMKMNNRNSATFEVTDSNNEKLQVHKGPVDFSNVTNVQPSVVVSVLMEYLNKNKFSHVQTNPYKLKCTKNGNNFDIEIFKLQDTQLFYVKFKFNHSGEYANKRKYVQELISEVKLFQY